MPISARKPSLLLTFALVALSSMTLVAGSGCQGPSSRGTEEAKKHHARASGLIDKGEYDTAIQECELALKIDPIYVLAMCTLGEACHKRGFTERAIKELENAIKTDPNTADAYKNLGDIYYDQKRYDESEKQYDTALETYANYDEAWFGKGRLYQAQNKLDRALECYTTATTNNPKFVEAHVAAGLLYLQNGVEKDANDHFLLALEYDPKNVLAQLGLGIMAFRKDQWEEAIKRHKTALEGLGERKGPEFDRQRKQVEESLAQIYHKAPARIAKTLVEGARELKAKGKLDEALSDLDTATRIDAKLVDPYIVRGDILLVQKKPDDAEKALKKALSMEPKNKDARFMLAVLYRATGKFRDSELILRELRREEPKVAKYRKFLGIAFYFQRQYRRAEREWKEGLELEPGDEDMKKALVKIYETPAIKKANELNDAALTVWRQGNLDDAYNLFKQALALDDQFAVAYANLAAVSIERGDLIYARTKAAEAIQHDPDLGRAHHQLGVVNVKEGKWDDARKNFLEAAACDTRDPEPHYNLGLMYLQVKREVEGLHELENATSIDANHFRSYFAIGMHHLSKNLVDKAESFLRLSITTGPKFIPGRVELARLFIRQRKHEEAIKLLEEAYALDNTAPEPLIGFAEVQTALGDRVKALNAYLEAAEAYRNRGPEWYPNEVDACRKALALDPNSARAYNDLGIALMDVAQYSEALAALKKADDLEPNNLEHRLNMGVLYGRWGKKTLAAECYKDIIRAKPAMKYRAEEQLAELYAEGASDNPITRDEAIQLLESAYRTEPHEGRKAVIQEILAKLKKR